MTKKLLEIESINKYLEKIEKGPITILGLSDVSKAVISEIIMEHKKGLVLLITYNELQAQKLHKNIRYLNKDVA